MCLPAADGHQQQHQRPQLAAPCCDEAKQAGVPHLVLDRVVSEAQLPGDSVHCRAGHTSKHWRCRWPCMVRPCLQGRHRDRDGMRRLYNPALLMVRTVGAADYRSAAGCWFGVHRHRKVQPRHAEGHLWTQGAAVQDVLRLPRAGAAVCANLRHLYPAVEPTTSLSDLAAPALRTCVGDRKTAPTGNGGVPCHVVLY